jgi:hypothetical protein
VGQHDAQLEWERRNGRLAAVAAIASVVLTVAAQILSASAATDREGERHALITLDEHRSEVIAGAVLQTLSAFMLAAVLLYLLRCTRYRRTEGVIPAVGPLVALAPFLFGVGSVLSQLDVLDIANDFAAGADRSERRADNVLDDRSAAPIFIGYAGNIALGFGLVVISLNAMRAGLLTRFLGILGIIVGALYVIPLFTGPLIVQIFWLGALAAIFLGYWPGGRGKAWETGTAVHWPSAAERRREALGAAAAADAEQEPLPEPEPEAPERPGPSRRRRKRRR